MEDGIAVVVVIVFGGCISESVRCANDAWRASGIAPAGCAPRDLVQYGAYDDCPGRRAIPHISRRCEVEDGSKSGGDGCGRWLWDGRVSPLCGIAKGYRVQGEHHSWCLCRSLRTMPQLSAAP